jgi:RNA polymerase sigma-70 factor (ECF subfamily)
MDNVVENRDTALEQDQALVERCLTRDADAWEMMVKAHGKRIFNLCYRFTGRKDEAEDLTQEIFIRVYQNLKSFRSDSGCLQSWLLRLSRNLIIDHYRHTKRAHRSLAAEELDTMNIEDLNTPDPYRATEHDESNRIVMNGLTALLPEVKEAILLRDIEGLSYQEIAELLGVPAGTIKSRVSRGRLRLATIICKRHACLYGSSKPNSIRKEEMAVAPARSKVSRIACTSRTMELSTL